jgi:hypothetical protein
MFSTWACVGGLLIVWFVKVANVVLAAVPVGAAHPVAVETDPVQVFAFTFRQE